MTSLVPESVADTLSVEEVLQRANMEFGFVQWDSERGLKYAAKKVARTGVHLSHKDKELAMELMVDTIELILGDNRRTDKHFLKCYVIPNGPIEVEYLYDSHDRLTLPLLKRFALALGYLISPG